MTKKSIDIDLNGLGERIERLPGISPLREAAAGRDAYLVGGAVRDLLLGHDRADLDVAVEGDIAPIAQNLGGEVREHERFATATVDLDGMRVDLASARIEIYDHPGALPRVDPATLDDDLARRDFTINAMAVPLADDLPPSDSSHLIDPHNGLADLREGLLRVLHQNSFRDDPTRALRAARYASRFGFEPGTDTEELLPAADLGTVSADRVEAELRRMALEPNAGRAFELASGWGTIEVAEDRQPLIDPLIELLGAAPWQGLADRADAVMLLLGSGPGTVAHGLSEERPERRSEIARLARVHAASPEVLAVARVLGAAWLDLYVEQLREVELEIDGADLMDAGVPEGPAIGRGLEAALDAKLDGKAEGRDAELAVALEAAR